jgi:DNA-binding CsgD family transcriptional regulator
MKRDFINSLFSTLNIWLYVIDLNSFDIVESSEYGVNPNGFGYECQETNLLNFIENQCHLNDRLFIIENLHLVKTRQQLCWSGIFRIQNFDGQWKWVYNRLGIIDESITGNSSKAAGILLELNTCSKTEEQLNTLIKDILNIRNQQRLNKLTPREITIIKLIVQGNSYTKIAQQLHIQPDTVNCHRKHILRKLELSNIAMLACFANEVGLV